MNDRLLDPVSRAAIRSARAALSMVANESPAEHRAVDAFSIASVLRAHLARDWARIGSSAAAEYAMHRVLSERYGVPANAHAVRLPDDVLATRDMTAAGVQGSQFLVGVGEGPIGYLPALQPFSAPLRLGAQIVSAGSESIAAPRGAVGATAHWLGDENTMIGESQPQIGATAAVPKTVAALTEISHQALRQSNAEAVVRLELARAAAAAVTRALLQGTGASGQPQGIVGTSGVGAFTGASLGYAALVNGMTDVALANGAVNLETLGWCGHPGVADLLKQRYRVANTDTPLWQGDVSDGAIEGKRALSTTAAAAASLVYGDWSQAWTIQWAGGVQLLVDPFSKFDRGIVGVRLLLLVDTFIRPAAFSAATSIT